MWLGGAELAAGSSCVPEAGLLVSMGEPSSWDTPTGTGSKLSAISGLREAEKAEKQQQQLKFTIGKQFNICNAKGRGKYMQ